MQRLEVSGGVRQLLWSLGVKGLIACFTTLHQQFKLCSVSVGKLSLKKWEKFWYE